MSDMNNSSMPAAGETRPYKKIQESVYHIRGQEVMLDKDLAEIYGYSVKAFNQQVKRNISRFPSDFMFQLTRDEVELVKSQIVTSPDSNFYSGQDGGSRKPPFAFTEQGIYMLAAVLHGSLAEQQSIYIMRAFREMRHIIEQNRQIIAPSEALLLQVANLSRKDAELDVWKEKTDASIKDIQERIELLSENFISGENIQSIVIYKNQKFEADAAYADIFSQAKKSVFVIDDYVNIKTLELLKHKRKGVSVIIFSENKGSKGGRLSAVEVEDFNLEYPQLVLRGNQECHDRFIILDYGEKSEAVFHCGASVKDAGAKVCGINRIDDVSLLHPVVERLLG